MLTPKEKPGPQTEVKRLAMALSVLPVALPSKKMTDCPGAMLMSPRRAIDDEKEFELSSTRQPPMFTVSEPKLVSSNQSASMIELPLLQGATSVTNMSA